MEGYIKRGQEQAVAAWIQMLNNLRAQEVLQRLAQQGENFENAWRELQKLKVDIYEEVISRQRGGTSGMHGFIGERCQVAIENARSLVKGLEKEYFLIDDNGPSDYLKGDIPVQQKCVQAKLGFEAIKKHLEQYPDFVKRGGKYHIPKDYYEKFEKIFYLSEEQAGKLEKEDYRLWKYFHKFFDETGLTADKVESMVVGYDDVQANNVDSTIKREEAHIAQENKTIKETIVQDGAPTLKEGAKVTAVAALTEGTLALCVGVIKRVRAGKKIAEFTADDWKELGIDTLASTGKGAIRGASIYVLSNFAKTPAPVASGMVTAVFGIVSEAVKLRQGKVAFEEFVVNCEAFCIEVAVSTISSTLGNVVIPVPVLGAIIGNTVGMFLLNIGKTYLSEQEYKLIEEYVKKVHNAEIEADKQYNECMARIKDRFGKFSSALELAFDEDVNKAFFASVTLAEQLGVPDEMVLKTMAAGDTYFTD